MSKPKNINNIINLYSKLRVDNPRKRLRDECYDPNPRKLKRRKIFIFYFYNNL